MSDDEKNIPSVVVATAGDVLTLKLGDSSHRFHSFWLLDNSRHMSVRDADNGQRLITLVEQPESCVISSAEIAGNDAIEVRFAHDDNVHIFSSQWLLQHAYDVDTEHKQSGWLSPSITTWGASHSHDLVTADYAELQQRGEALKAWLAGVARYGLAMVNALPDDADALLDVVDLFGYVRETNYGRYFEVKSTIDPVNLAYTNLGLAAHTDNPYREPVPTLQLLSCIENTTDGGESVVVDGFHCAAQLRNERPDYFALLSQYCARFNYSGSAGVNLQSKRAMLQLAADGELVGVCFNNRSAAPFVDIPFAVMHDYYAAYRYYQMLLQRPENTLSFKLSPGSLFIVDNTRVLHARTAFSSAGTRWLRGCYADKDGLLSTLACL